MVLTRDTILGDLLMVSKPLAHLEGEMGQPPEVEDLHVYMLEEGISAAKQKVRAAPRACAAAAAAAAAGVCQTAGCLWDTGVVCF